MVKADLHGDPVIMATVDNSEVYGNKELSHYQILYLGQNDFNLTKSTDV